MSDESVFLAAGMLPPSTETTNETMLEQTPFGEVNNSFVMAFAENATLLGNETSAKLPPGGTVSSSTTMLAYLLETGRFQIPLYSIIFLLAVIGNSLVILTLVQNKRMRTITNLFLLNLAVSDLFLGVFCMPFTLVGMLLRDFIFGEVMCKLLPYLQASSVAVSAWTLVIISVERYYAICHPLRSRRWQTLSHAYRLIALIWCGSLFFMLPIAALSKLIPTNQGHHKCRELWFERSYERAYNLFLDVILLVLPLVILGVTYSLITRNLCRGMQQSFRRYSKTTGSCRERVGTTVAGGEGDSEVLDGSGRGKRWSQRKNNNNNRATDQYMEVYIRPNGSTRVRCPSLKCHRETLSATKQQMTVPDNMPGGKQINTSSFSSGWSQQQSSTTIQWPTKQLSEPFRSYPSSTGAGSSPGARSATSVDSNGKESMRAKNPALRKSNMEKSLMNKKRIIKMLFVVVLEFFLCWTPLYVINTMALFWPSTVYHNLGYTAISFFQLLAYSSSCCNPITYCFMSGGFRKAFLNLFRCFRGGGGGEMTGNASVRNRRNSATCTMYVTRGSSSSKRNKKPLLERGMTGGAGALSNDELRSSKQKQRDGRTLSMGVLQNRLQQQH
ncbi:cholecystokinin receptor type A-like [Topomyia yanbarensis]|uniref:cholecystokinin receptor type A-like n=1 Tax=Topomyia yanbarensis TaxID=2498891 RepID=UPI00273CD7B8|nr:cholecystokinin receptor type A-like [Topomyia yanbarensis]